MTRVRIVGLSGILLLTVLPGTTHCGGETGGDTSGGASGGRAGVTGGSSNTAASGGATASSGGAAVATGGSPSAPGLVACNDGTGRFDCCPSGASPGSSCDPNKTPSCSRGCANGYSSNLYCGNDEKWGAGKGLFPCGVDASAPSGHEACKVGDDSGAQTISVTDYDTSCESSEDCVAVGEGDACSGVCAVVCPISGINRKDESRYRAALAKILPDPPPFCGCPASFGPCCMNGHCSTSWQCVPPSP